MRLACIAFTGAGAALGAQLAPRLQGCETELAAGYGEDKVDLNSWTRNAFEGADALLFIGAAGIAVRAVASLVQSKTTDPAVVVMDESGRWVIPLLSGHIGGANRLAEQLAALCGGQAVLTTATDVRGLWAVDEWAARRGLAIVNPRQIKLVSARLLAGAEVGLCSEMPLRKPLPEGVIEAEDMAAAHVVLSPFKLESEAALQLVPHCVNVGIGCRKSASATSIDAAFTSALKHVNVMKQAVCAVHSIDIKQNEPGLLAFCEKHSLPFVVHSSVELQEVAGSVSSSGFVQSVTGVDNVCERSALAGGGRLLLPKRSKDGVTIALAIQEITYGFEENE